ncbi:MAG: hypothetical protein KGN34_12300 [Sphingomonadales bacterium]|nr:hypothetical protein [Sphingomonadales bacterium]
MPTIASSVVPPPKSWDEFEDITLAAANLRWNTNDFQRNGRPGQAQNGVDVFGHDEHGLQLGIQCKNTVGGVSFNVIELEIKSAETFQPPLAHLYVATTAKRDAPLQQAVRMLSAERRKAGLFPVNVLFWDDICGDLATDDDIFFAHYPQFRTKTDPAREHDLALFNELSALLRSDGVIGFLDQANMAGFSHLRRKLEPLWDFHHGWNRPEREFISPKLESIRSELWNKADEYSDVYSENTFSANNVGYAIVPPEWEYQNPEHFLAVVRKLHSLAGEIVELHREFIRTGRQELIAGIR